jgi:hypothetical protein
MTRDAELLRLKESTCIKDGYTRTTYADCVHWTLNTTRYSSRRITYLVARFPFVPDYHLCELVEDYYNVNTMMAHVCERPLQHFKTLTHALDVLKVIEGSQS